MKVAVGAARARHLLAAIVVASVAVSLVWLVRVPIFGQPDENTHVDYALALWSARRPISAAEHPLGTDVSPDTRALARAGDFDTVRFDAGGRVSRDYGTARAVRATDAAAPADPGWYARAVAVPYIAASYPPGFYALEAIVFGTVRALTHSLVFAFFAMRAVGTCALAATLVCSYAIVRELRVSRALALAIVATIGLFPLVDWTFAYVQPDDLALLLADGSLLLTLRVRRLGPSARRTIALSALLAALAAVKLHAFAATLLAVAPIAAFALHRAGGGRALVLGTLAVALPAGCVLAGSAWAERHAATTHDYAHFAHAFARRPALESLADAARIAVRSLGDLYGTGVARHEYYHDFSWMETPISLGSAWADTSTDAALEAGTLVVLALVLARVARAAGVAARLVRRRSATSALRLLTGDPVWNLYAVYVCVLVAGIVYTGELIHLHGRYAEFVMLGAVLCAVRYAPRALPARLRRPAALTLASLLLAYSVVDAGFGLAALDRRFYVPAPATGGPPVEYAIELEAFRPDGSLERIARSVPRRSVVRGWGWALDSHRTTTTTVGATIDGRLPVRVRNGLSSEDEVDHLNDTRLAHGGFAFSLDASRLTPGTHALAFYAIERNRRAAFAGAPNLFRVDP